MLQKSENRPFSHALRVIDNLFFMHRRDLHFNILFWDVWFNLDLQIQTNMLTFASLSDKIK